MTRKRFIKLLMSKGVEKDVINGVIAFYLCFGNFSYAELYKMIEPAGQGLIINPERNKNDRT